VRKSNQSRLGGMRGFTLIWIGQLVSLLGSGMTGFGVSIWAWEITGQATALALAFFFNFAPSVLLSPFAGAIVDRSNRKLVMILSDLAAGLSTVVLLILLVFNRLEIWHLYAANLFSGVFNAFQFPAYSAAVSTMLPKEQYGRANGMIGLTGAASGILAPIAAGAVIGWIGLKGIMLFDVITFVFAITMLLVVQIPQPQRSLEGQAAQGNLLQESLFGFKYIFARRSLLGLQMVLFMVNLSATFGFTVMVPMILARTGNNELTLGSVQSIAAIGGLVGGLLLSTWGGPKRRIHGFLVSMILAHLFGAIPFGLGQSFWFWAIGAFMMNMFIPILNGSNQAIWQAKVMPDIQGRVFAARRLIAQITAPIAILASGPLADYFFEPAMQPGGMLAGVFGGLVGTGSGAGMGLMFVFSGIVGAFVGVSGYLFPFIRNAEDILPDHDETPIPQVGIEKTEREQTDLGGQRTIDPARLARLQKLLVLRQHFLQSPEDPERSTALKMISKQLRQLGKVE